MESSEGLHEREYAFDVFWSHTREQKPLVEKLNTALKEQATHHNNFLDTNYNSLPPGQDFPSNIARAIRSCRLAVVVLSRSFLERYWPMKELGELAVGNTEQLILPVFYALAPRELDQNSMNDRVRSWKERFPWISDDTLKKWEAALLRIRNINGFKIPEPVDSSVDVRSTPLLQRLLSDIRLLLAAQVIKAGNVLGEKLHLVCIDITSELSEENKSVQYIGQSVGLLIKEDIIPNLVVLLQKVNGWVKSEVAWALDSVLYRASSTDAKAQAINAGAVEALVDMLVYTNWEDPAAFCLRIILASKLDNEASSRLIAKDKLNGGTLERKLVKVIVKKYKKEKNSKDPSIDACIEILDHLIEN